MKLKIEYTFMIVMLSMHLVNAQFANFSGRDNVVLRTKKHVDVKGSPYLYVSWGSGTVTDQSGKIYGNLLLRYDTYYELLELNQDGQVYEISPESFPKFTLNYVDSVTKKETNHVFSTGYKIDGFSELSYFDIFADGKYKIVRKYKTLFLEETISDYGSPNVKKIFQSKTHYFLLTRRGLAKEIKLTRKSILEAFPDQSSAIEAFIKEKKIKVKSEQDLMDIVKFLEAH